MASAVIKTRGVKGAARAFNALPSLVTREIVAPALQGGAESLAEAAKRSAHFNARQEATKRPSQSRGRTRRSLRTDKRARIRGKIVRAAVRLGGVLAPHAVFVEFGTKKGRKPQLILVRAMQHLQGQTRDGIRREGRAALRRNAGRLRARFGRGR